MNKITNGLLACALMGGSFAMLADTGVVVHDINGNSTFFPSENIDYVEFVGDDYQADGLALTNNIKNLSVGQNLQATAVVTAQCSKGLILTDNAGSIFYYNTNVNLSTYSVGTVVKVSGAVNNYGTGLQLTNAATLTLAGEKNYTYPVPTAYSATMIDQAVANTSYVLPKYVTIEGALEISNGYYNINISGTSYQGSFYAPVDNIKAKLTNGNSYKFTGYFTGITSGKYFYMVLTDVKDVNDNSSSGNTTVDGYTYPLSYVQLPGGTPQQVKDYTGFTVNFNKNNHTPNYVAWELLSSETNGSVATNRNYWVDNTIEGCLSTDFGYATYGYERGHMIPAADCKWSSEAMKDAACMTNMVPQLSSLNGGMWSTLENKVRTWAQRDGALWIVAGPIYKDTDDLYVGAAKARVPSGCFKAILYYNGDQSRAIAFAFANGSNTGNLQDFAMSIDDLEAELGYDFFSTLPDEIENYIEANYSFTDWNK